MMTTTWCFGLLLSTGQVLAIETIESINMDHDGGLWLNAVMLNKKRTFVRDQCEMGPIATAPTGRRQVSINARHVVAAFELIDT